MVPDGGTPAGYISQTEGYVDILVQLEEGPDHSPVLAHVNSVPSPLGSGRGSRDVVTLYGVPTPESLALALAAAVESHRGGADGPNTIRHLGIWPERGAIGDAAWRDHVTGQLMTRDVDIPLERLRETAAQLLLECGQMLRRLLAGLVMPDWPEGARRAINCTIGPLPALAGAAGTEGFLDLVREADGQSYDSEGD